MFHGIHVNKCEKMCWNDKNESSIEERLLAKQLLWTAPSVSQEEEGPKARGFSYTAGQIFITHMRREVSAAQTKVARKLTARRAGEGMPTPPAMTLVAGAGIT